MATNILESLRSYFTENQWVFDQLEGKTILRMGFKGEAAEWTCFAQAREQQQQAVFYSRASIHVPMERRLAVAEFITRANYGMILGNFEQDMEDGEIRYKTSIDVEGSVLTSSLIHQLVGFNVHMMDQYLPGVMAVAFGGISPKEALAQIEAPRGNPGNA